MPIRDGLAAEYGFAGNADDTSGAGRHGVVHGPTLTQDRFGRPNHAYHFDGEDDYIEVAPPPAIGAGAMSVSAWARCEPRNFRGWTNCIVAQDDGADVEGQPRRVFQLSTDNGHIVWHRMACLRDPMCKRRVRSGIWCHVAGVHDRGEHRLYVDGVLCDTVAHDMWTHASQPMHIGRKGTAERFFFFRGDIDDVRVYHRALSSDEVLELLREGGWQPPPAMGLPVEGDPLSGQWGQRGVVFLSLKFDGVSRVTGHIMAGRPNNPAAIASGAFDRKTAALRLEGRAKHHKTGEPIAWALDGTLDEGEIVVTARFNGYSGNFMLTRRGSRLRWSRDSMRSHLEALLFPLRRRRTDLE